MKIGIIGSNGFIGRNLKKYFQDHKLHNVYNFSSYTKFKKNWINKVSSEIAIFKPEIIINCAASQILDDDKKSIQKLLNSNLHSNIYFLNKATQNKNFKGYITFGTKWEYDKNRNFDPLNFYAATKHANDVFLKYFSIKKKVSTVSLKIFDTFGEHDNRNKILNLLLKSYKKNKVLKMTSGNQYLDFVHIDDISKLILMICEDIKSNKLKDFNYYTVSSKKPVKLKMLINQLKRSLDHELKVMMGKKKYRTNEAMSQINKIKNYPGWKPGHNLVNMIVKIFDGTND
jgi:CDP-paratose synthetase